MANVASRLKFSKRARVQTTDLYRRRIWTASDSRHRVSEFVSCLERRRVFYAERFEDTPTGGCWSVISRHRRKSRAFVACERDY